MDHRHPFSHSPLPVLAVLAILAVATPLLPAASAEEGAIYGAGVTLTETTAIADILSDPAAWAGETVRVEGRVTGVCQRMGCWIELASPGGTGQRLRIKVDDGVIVFPPQAEGRMAVAQGVVVVRQMSREQYAAFARHQAEEQGASFDESGLGEGPFEVVEIAGSGAEIAPPG